MPTATAIFVFAQHFKAGCCLVPSWETRCLKTRFTSIKLLQPPSDHQGELLPQIKELIGGHSRTEWGLLEIPSIKQGGQLPLSLLPGLYSLQTTSSGVSLGKDFWLSSSSGCKSRCSKKPHQVFSTTYTAKLILCWNSAATAPLTISTEAAVPQALFQTTPVFDLWNIKPPTNQNPSVLPNIWVF